MHGRYAIYDALQALGSGAAASVYLGVSRGAETVPVAIKRLHAGQARQAASVARLLDEVRLARHIVHPNVVRTIDFVSDGEEMLAVMEYVHGEPLSRLLSDARAASRPMPVALAIGIASDVLHGLQAAHVATDGEGKPLRLVHRDVTPENILVGTDGRARLMDFGVAKAEGRLHTTRDGGVRGKLAYLAPEQIGGEVTSRTDLYAVGLVLWEMLVGERALVGENEGELLVKALDPHIAAPSTRNAQVPRALDAAVARAIAKEPNDRFADATEQAAAFERAAAIVGSPAEVGAWVRAQAGDRLAARAASIDAMLAAEGASARGAVRPRVQARGVAVLFATALVVLGIGLAWRAQASAPVPDADKVSLPPGMAATAAVLPAAVLAAAPPAAPSASAPLAPLAPLDSAPRRPAWIPPPSTRARAATPRCDPPWTLDANGIRRYDPACTK